MAAPAPLADAPRSVSRTRAISRYVEVDRARWERLTTGIYADQWRELLSRSGASPPFPAEEPRQGGVLFWACVLGSLLVVTLLMMRKLFGR